MRAFKILLPNREKPLGTIKSCHASKAKFRSQRIKDLNVAGKVLIISEECLEKHFITLGKE